VSSNVQQCPTRPQHGQRSDRDVTG
jgi:hypothetical protein